MRRVRPVADCRRAVFERLGLRDVTCLAVGVDRFDYTKGIPERLNAVERLLEKHSQWVGRIVFVQVMLADAGHWRQRERIEAGVQRHRVGWGDAVPTRTALSVPSDGRGPRP